ncbi:hypothetical protein GCK32_008821 [Trichostrongylus colubriformis]|uniref:Protein regulator of cytokinesis 1 n=1 Tax=Trichostrongylus colubriformis TaxID=6319 RepID=A0AAN8F0T6_TRICO
MPDHQLNALDARRLELEDMLQKRLKKVQKWQKEMVKFVRKLGQSAVPDDESIKAIMDIDFTGEEICISDTTVAKMEECHGQLREMYIEYVQDREFRWLELYTRLAELWDLCHVADIERLIPPSYNPDKHSDEDIDKISTEISRLESLYGARKEVFDILTTWKEKWAEKLALEEKKKDPEYFQNRGRENNVYMDAKIERTLNDYTLPKLLKTLITAYEKYCQTHPNDEIRCCGPKHSSPKTSTPRGGLDTSKKTTPLKTVKRTPISGTRLSVKKRTPLSSIKTPGNTRTPLRRSRRFFKV